MILIKQLYRSTMSTSLSLRYHSRQQPTNPQQIQAGSCSLKDQFISTNHQKSLVSKKPETVDLKAELKKGSYRDKGDKTNGQIFVKRERFVTEQCQRRVEEQNDLEKIICCKYKNCQSSHEEEKERNQQKNTGTKAAKNQCQYKYRVIKKMKHSTKVSKENLSETKSNTNSNSSDKSQKYICRIPAAVKLYSNHPKQSIRISNPKENRMYQSTHLINTDSTLQSIRSDQYEMLMGTINKLETDRTELEAKLDAEMKEVVRLNKENSGLKVKLKEMQGDIEQLQRQKSKYLQIYQKRTIDSESKNNRILEIRVKQENDRNLMLQKQVQRLGSEIKALNSSFQTLQTEKSQLLQQNYNSEQQINNLQSLLGQKSQWVHSLSKKVWKLQAEQHQISQNYEARIKQLDSQILELKKQQQLVKEKENTIEVLKLGQKQKDQILSRFIKEKKGLIAQVADLQAKMYSLQKKNEPAKHETCELLLEQLKVKVNISEEQAKYLRNELEKIQKDKSQLFQKILKLEQQNRCASPKGKSPRKQRKNQPDQQRILNKLIYDMKRAEREVDILHKTDIRQQQLIENLNEEITRLQVTDLAKKYSKMYTRLGI